ncbi:anti-sigma-D factor RsdA [Pseudonocardia lacus]|uniref:anti-sigma-D factor RsdA n=1 Tax=Pseudonocardia lacus TaxID=2835865 RepID=UPI001BDCD787|nr:anti-sigma-D factor RsdA [Pseudonocardia lacus]
MRTRAVPLHDQDLVDTDVHEPVDLVAVQADDELINALSSGLPVVTSTPVGYGSEDRVAAILAAWRAEVDAEPVPELLDVDTAVAAIAAARDSGSSLARRRSARARHLAPVAAAAAFLVITMGGVSIGSASAQPDDVLWPISKVLFSERAASVEAADRVQDHIDRAKQALVEGRPDEAAGELQLAQADLGAIRPEEGQVELADVQDFLLAKAAETPPGEIADLTAPLSTQPSRPVPPGVLDPTDPAQPLPAFVPSDGGPAKIVPGSTSNDPRRSPGTGGGAAQDETDEGTPSGTVPRESAPETSVEPSPTDEEDTVPLPPGDDVLPGTTSPHPEPTTTNPGITEGQAPAQSSGTSTGTSTGTAQGTVPPTS